MLSLFDPSTCVRGCRPETGDMLSLLDLSTCVLGCRPETGDMLSLFDVYVVVGLRQLTC